MLPEMAGTSLDDNAFFKNSHVAYLIPARADFDIEQEIAQFAASRRKVDSGSDSPSFIDHVVQRQSLFFDETVEVYLVLRAPRLNEKAVRNQLKRLSLSLEAHVVVSSPATADNLSGGTGQAPPAEVIYQGAPDSVFHDALLIPEDPTASEPPSRGSPRNSKIDGIAPDRHDDGQAKSLDQQQQQQQQQYLFAVWKLAVFMARPNMRLQNPAVVFSVMAELRPLGGSVDMAARDGYLSSGRAAATNLLESFASDPALGGVQPRLSALRVSIVAPLTGDQYRASTVSAQKNRSLKIYPVVHTRVRFARPNTAPPSPSIIAMLEVDFTPYFECQIMMESIKLSATDVLVEDLNEAGVMTLPLQCVAHDQVTFLYRLTPVDMESIIKRPIRNLEARIDATALMATKELQPRLTMTWTTPVDFTLPLNSSFGGPTPAIQRSHRPGQLSISGGGDVLSLTSPSVMRPDSIPTLEAAARTEAAAALEPTDIGVAITLTGPSGPVYVGEVFTWTIFVVNHVSMQAVLGATGKHSARKLAVTLIHSRRRPDIRSAMLPALPAGTDKGMFGEASIAEAVLDENLVYSMQQSYLFEPLDVICLSADIRIGPLAPGACHAAEMKFLALKEGIINVAALRVIDLLSNEHVDIHELPFTVVLKREEGRP